MATSSGRRCPQLLGTAACPQADGFNYEKAPIGKICAEGRQWSNILVTVLGFPERQPCSRQGGQKHPFMKRMISSMKGVVIFDKGLRKQG